MSVQNVLLKQ
nr:unnamed protein product [Callosobruchus analis]